jgi:hypothetical protein
MTLKHPHPPIRKKLKTVQSPGKVMSSVFWDVNGVLLVDFTPLGSMINAAAYQETVGRLKESHKKRSGLLTTGVILLQENARTYSSVTTVNLLNYWGWEVLPRPPHSPDLAPSHFSNCTSVKMFKMMSRNGYVPGAHFFFL